MSLLDELKMLQDALNTDTERVKACYEKINDATVGFSHGEIMSAVVVFMRTIVFSASEDREKYLVVRNFVATTCRSMGDYVEAMPDDPAELEAKAARTKEGAPNGD